MVHVSRALTACLLFVALSSCSEAEAPQSGADVLFEAAQSSLSQASLERYARAIVQYQRPSGSPGENAAIDSVVAALEEAGVPVTVHSFDTYASDPVAAAVSVPGAGSFDSLCTASPRSRFTSTRDRDTRRCAHRRETSGARPGTSRPGAPHRGARSFSLNLPWSPPPASHPPGRPHR